MGDKGEAGGGGDAIAAIEIGALWMVVVRRGCAGGGP